MYKCLFCGVESTSEKARFCSECGPEGPASSWSLKEVDCADKVEQYASNLGEFYFETNNETEVEKFSLRLRERLKISHSTHREVLARFSAQKKEIAHLSNFLFEFNENVTDAYAGHDTFLNFRYTNLSDDDLTKVNLLWDNPDTIGRVDLRADTKVFVKPHASVLIGGSTIFDRIGIKELADLQITVSNQLGEKANFRVEPFRFKVGNHEQRVTQNISTHNQISIEGRGVVDASGMGTEQRIRPSDFSSQPHWIELKFSYIPEVGLQFDGQKNIPLEPSREKNRVVEIAQSESTNFDKNDLLSVLKAAEQGDVVAQNTLGDMYAEGEGVAQNDQLAVQWYQRSGAQGFARAQENLGDMYEAGLGVAQDEEEAVNWYRKAADQGDAGGQRSLALMYHEGKGVAQNYEQAFRWFEKAAVQGDAGAQYGLGLHYEEGLGVETDDEKSLIWYRKAAEQGYQHAQHRLAKSYHLGRGIAQNYEQSFHWYQQAADQGYPNSQNNLGLLYECGLGVPQDYEKAVKFYRLAADQDFAFSQNNLARMYEAGLGVDQSDELAFHWYRKSAEQQDASAEFNLGWLYDTGRGVEKNLEQAVYWYRKAVEQEHPAANHNLGCMYLYGNGVSQDDVQAELLFRKAADMGYASAQHNLGWMYQMGRGVAQNNDIAMQWYQRAAEQGFEGSIKALESLGVVNGALNYKVNNFSVSYNDSLLPVTYAFPIVETQVEQFKDNECISPQKSVSESEFNSVDEIITYYANRRIAALGVNFYIKNSPKFDKKIQNFSQSFSKVHYKPFIPEEDVPVLFYDGTILGSGKDGIVFASNSIYAKGCLGRSVEHVDISYGQIDSVRMTTQKVRDKEIYIESSGHLELISLNPIYATPEDLLLIVEMLNKIRQFIKDLNSR